MPSLHFEKRDSWCFGYSCSSSWAWGRWILFVLLIVGLLALVLSAFRINRRRGLQGVQPIRGTAWITPPSYQHAARQDPYVPAYTQEANDNDMGYYDNQGVFHVNNKAKEAPSYHMSTLVPDQTGVSSPQPATTSADPDETFARDFTRYYGSTAAAPPVSSPTATAQTEQSEDYSRPGGPPPPAHVR